MGSFNLSCFASHQTIAPHDRCYVLPIIQGRTYRKVTMRKANDVHEQFGIANSTCYPSAFWAPFAGFIEAEYDDYGRVNLVNSSTNLVRLASFIGSLCEVAPEVLEGENTTHDVAFDLPDFLSHNTVLLQAMMRRENTPVDDLANADLFDECETVWNYIWEVAQKQRLFAADHQQHIRPLQFAVIHAVAYEKLWQMGEATWDKSEIVAELMAKVTPLIGFEGEDLGMMAWPIETAYKKAVQGIGSEPFDVFPGETEEALSVVNDIIRGRIPAADAELAFDELLNARFVNAMLQWLNMRYAPMITAGQDYDNDIGESVAEFITATSKEVSAVREGLREDEDEDDEEDEEED